jgi:hypothetical protein
MSGRRALEMSADGKTWTDIGERWVFESQHSSSDEAWWTITKPPGKSPEYVVAWIFDWISGGSGRVKYPTTDGNIVVTDARARVYRWRRL